MAKVRNTARFAARRTVRLTTTTQSKTWAKLWAYSYADLAELFGLTEIGVRKAVSRQRLNPADLRSICLFWADGEGLLPRLKLEALEAQKVEIEPQLRRLRLIKSDP